jgi:hypothetical protein
MELGIMHEETRLGLLADIQVVERLIVVQHRVDVRKRVDMVIYVYHITVVQHIIIDVIENK